MQVIARMNVGGPAVIVTELMKGLNPANFQAVLVTGYCAEDEAEYLEENKQNFSVSRISGLGRSVSFFADFKSFISLVLLIRKFTPTQLRRECLAGLLD